MWLVATLRKYASVYLPRLRTVDSLQNLLKGRSTLIGEVKFQERLYDQLDLGHLVWLKDDDRAERREGENPLKGLDRV